MHSAFSVLLVCLAIAQAPLARGEIEECSFRFEEGLLWVEAITAEGGEPLNLILDTGAEVSVLDLEAARRLDVKLGRPVTVRGVGSATTGYWPVKMRASAGAARLPSKFLGLDLSALDRACEQKVDGLIGADFFRAHVVRIDFEIGKVQRSKKASMSDASALPLEVGRRGMLVVADINGVGSQRLRVDTGCATALQWVTRSAVESQYKVGSATGLAALRIPQTSTTVRLGGHNFRDVPTGLHEKPIFTGEAGLLGNGLLARFRSVTFDSVRGRLLLSL